MTQSTICIGPPARRPTCCNVWQSGTDSASLAIETGSAIITTAEPIYDPSIHTSVWYDDFESYTAGSAPSSAYTLNQSHGSIVIDNAVAYAGSQSCKFTVNGGCLSVGNDANVGLEKGLSGLSNYSSSQRVWYVSWYAKHDVGYYDLNCGGEFKELYIFRLAGGDATGSASFIATKNGGPLVCPDFYGSNVVPSGTIGWSLVAHSEAGCTKPVSCSSQKELLRQELARTTFRPIDIDDGNWHHITFQFRRESAIDAGDGGIWQWVDGTKVLSYDGTDATDVAFGQVYTRTTEFRLIQIFGVVNQSLSSTGNRWLDELRVFRNTT